MRSGGGGKFYKKPFSRHPKGFHIFLPPDRVTVSDEYKDSDPYAIEKTIRNDFQKRRMDLTINLLQQAVSTVQGQSRILDIGCGQGHLTQAMYQTFNSSEFTGCDYSVSAIEYAYTHFPAIDFSVCDAYDLPYADEYFDVVVCNNLWEHVPDPLCLLSEIKKVLKLNGYLIISTPNRYRRGNLLRLIMGKPVAFMSKHHVTEYSIGQVIEQLAYEGFQTRNILSRPLSDSSLMSKVLRRVFTIWKNSVGSHSLLESTVFYLSEKIATTGK